MSVVAAEELVLDQAAVNALFAEARTANAFTDEPVSEEQARAIYELTKFGPTAFNSQPLRITYVRSSEARRRLVSHLSRGNQAKTESAPLTAILSYDSNWHEKFPEFLPAAAHLKDSWNDNADGRHKVANNSANLQAGYFILAVRTVGLAAGPMSGFDAAGLDADFFPGGNTHSFLVVNIGKPAENAWGAPKPRFAYEDVVTTV